MHIEIEKDEHSTHGDLIIRVVGQNGVLYTNRTWNEDEQGSVGLSDVRDLLVNIGKHINIPVRLIEDDDPEPPDMYQSATSEPETITHQKTGDQREERERARRERRVSEFDVIKAPELLATMSFDELRKVVEEGAAALVELYERKTEESIRTQHQEDIDAGYNPTTYEDDAVGAVLLLVGLQSLVSLAESHQSLASAHQRLAAAAEEGRIGS